VCKAAPIPGETKVWQYITLTKNVYLVDCPGVVPPSNETNETELCLKGVVRIEKINNPSEHIGTVLERVKPEYIFNQYAIRSWEDPVDFLRQFCLKTGRLLKGGEADIEAGARMILQDWQRGRLPYVSFQPAPTRLRS
jgi:nuclear GTP-binding protein